MVGDIQPSEIHNANPTRVIIYPLYGAILSLGWRLFSSVFSGDLRPILGQPKLAKVGDAQYATQTRHGETYIRFGTHLASGLAVISPALV